MTGTCTASATARVSAMSKPLFVPSRSIEVSRISPAPSSLTSRAYSHCVDPRCAAPAVGEDFPASLGCALGVNGDDDALRAEFFRRFANEAGIGHGGGIDRDLVGAGEQQIADVVQRAHAAAHSQRHEAGFRRALHDVEQNAAVFMACGDVEKAEFVGAGGVIGDGAFDRIAGVAQIDEIDAFDDASVLSRPGRE